MSRRPIAWSFEALLRLGRLVVPPGLVPLQPGAEVIASRWPFQVATMAGAECRLAHGQDCVDWAFWVERDHATSRLTDATFAAPRATAPGAERFLATWIRSAGALHAGVPSIWLEFDHEPLARGDALPFVTFRLGDEIGHDSLALEATLAAGLAALADDGRSRAAAVAAFASRLPRDVLPLHVAAMPHRRHAATRVILSTPAGRLRATAARIGWPGDDVALESIVASLWRPTSTTSFAVDVGDGIGPRAAVECYLPASPRDDPRWMRLLDGLVDRGACTAEKRDALVAWPTREGDPNDDARLARQLLVKLVFEADRLVEAKAYLAFTPRLSLGSPARTPAPNAPRP